MGRWHLHLKYCILFLLISIISSFDLEHLETDFQLRRSRRIPFSWVISIEGKEGVYPNPVENIDFYFQQNYYWNKLNFKAKENVRSRIEQLNLPVFVPKLLEWINRNQRTAITGNSYETLEDVESSIISIYLLGSYLWGFEDVSPVDLDLTIFVKDSSKFKRIKRELTSNQKKYLFGNNPRAPDMISITIVGENLLQGTLDNPSTQEEKKAILTLMSASHSGFPIAGAVFRVTPPLWAEIASVEDLIRNAYIIKKMLKEVKLSPLERKELRELREKDNLSDEEEAKYRLLLDKSQQENKWHFKLIKRVIEIGLRIDQLYQQHPEIEKYRIIEYTNQFLTSEAETVLNQIISQGVTSENENFFFSLLTRGKIYSALEYYRLWIQDIKEKYLVHSPIETKTP